MFEDKKSPQIHVAEYRNSSNSSAGGFSKRSVLIILIVAVLAIAGTFALYIHSQKQIKALQQDLAKQQQDPVTSGKDDNQKLVDEVSKLVIVPKDETPTIATVSDLSKLKNQPFFDKAQVGDKVLIYAKAQTAILFRPSEHKIIELAPLSSTQSNTQTNTQPSTNP